MDSRPINYQPQYNQNYMPQNIPPQPPQTFQNNSYLQQNANQNFQKQGPTPVDMIRLAGQMNPKGHFSEYAPIQGQPKPPQMNQNQERFDQRLIGHNMNPVHNSNYQRDNRNHEQAKTKVKNEGNI